MTKYLNFDERGFNVEDVSTWTNSKGERKSDVTEFLNDVIYGFYKSLEITDETLHDLEVIGDFNNRTNKNPIIVLAMAINCIINEAVK